MKQILQIHTKYDLWICSLLLTSILTLSHIRMYGHDTNGWMLPARSWFVDMLRQGDIPFWFGVVKYGFPTTIAQFVGTFWSPYAIILALFGDYTARTLAIEFFLWRLTALIGTYWLARTHFVLKSDAVIVSAIFIGSGTFASQDVQLEIYVGMAMVPWIIGGIDRCVCGHTNRTRLLGSGVLGISGAVILWSGYPGIWIPFPFLIAPYALLRMIYSQRQRSLLRGFAFSFLGACLAIICFIPVILETISFPVFGDEYRTPIDPNVGLLNVLGLAGFILANPSYINPINAMPVYVGIIPFIVILIYYSRIIYVLNRKYLGFLRIFLYLVCAVILIYSYSYANIYLIILLIIAIIFLKLGRIFKVKYNKIDIIYLTATGWIIFWSTSGPIQNVLRPVLPLLSMVRWYYLQMYLAELFIILLSWSILKNLRVSDTKIKILIRDDNIVVAILILLLLFYFFILNILQIKNDIIQEKDKFGAVPLVWTFGCLSAVIIIFQFIITNVVSREKYKISRFGAITVLSLSVSLVVAFCAYVYNPDPPKWWDTLIELPNGINLLIDIIYLIIFTIMFISVSFLGSRKTYISVVALLCVLDTSIASARYFAETEIMNVGGNRAGPATVDTSVHGNERSKADSGGIVWLASTAPHAWAYPGTVPMAALVDKAWGEPSVFRNFAVFPFSWRYTGANEIYVDQDNLRSDIYNDNRCLIEEKQPIVNIRTFLSSKIHFSTENRCDRLLVWTDTWASGWTAEVNGRMARIYRINGALRGVEIEEGTVEIAWKYRPQNYVVAYFISLTGVFVSSGAIFFGLRDNTNNARVLT